MRRIAPTIVAAALAAMALLPGTATAKPGYFKVAPSHTLQLLPVRGTHGYRVDIAVFDGRPQLIAVRQSGEGASVVFYGQTKQRDTGDDLDADFGAAGRLRARFVPKKVRELKAPKGCVGGPTIDETGQFVGPLTFHGANDFTSFQVRRLRGAVTHSPGLVCRRSKPGPRPSPVEQEGVLRVVAGVPSGNTYFDAITEPAASNIPSTSSYVAFRRHNEGPVEILESVVVPAAEPLAIPDLTAALPASVTIEPPAPFSGSATIEAPSRATATLSGDLAVDFPATDEVPLTGPGIDAGLCRDYACSGSLPRALWPQRPKYGLGIAISQVEVQTIR
jgi:hypothetical protein